MMIKKLTFLFTGVAVSFALLGCGGNMPPKCDSKETKKLLVQILNQNLVEYGYTNAKVKTTGHRMLEEHKDAKEYTCEARAIITDDGETETEVVNYSVFLDENKKGQFFVQVNE